MLPSFGAGSWRCPLWQAVALVARGILEMVVFGGWVLRKSSALLAGVQKYFSLFTVGVEVPSVVTAHLP